MKDHRPAIRVSMGSACERCRRQKQRCDSVLPCRNCVNVRQKCVASTAPSSKRARTSLFHSSPSQVRAQHNVAHDAELPDYDTHSTTPSHTHSPERYLSPRLHLALPVERTIVEEFGASGSAVDITRRVLQLHHSPENRATFAIPDGESYIGNDSAQRLHTIAELIGVELAPKSAVDALLELYFQTVHWFSLVVYEPDFRQRYQSVMSSELVTSADRAFLLLLLMILVMSCRYADTSFQCAALQEMNLPKLGAQYLKQVRANFMDLLDEDNLEFVQVSILLGSYWLYWGKPRSSFTLLGAAIRSAQALSLHRENGERQSKGRMGSDEERKRIWWTIYTWDRFATVVYGKPLGINDKDCDVSMPVTFTEHILDIPSSELIAVELSPYQRSLNRVYQITSPILENMYSIRRRSTETMKSKATQIVTKVDRELESWYDSLPAWLNLDQSSDLGVQSSLETKIHLLQALSLRLTYLNLVIVIYRPFLADWHSCHKHGVQEGSAQQRSHADSFEQICESSFEQCLSAALAISRISQNKPNLVLQACKTHLFSFLTMNIFTSSVVLYIYAAANILSNAAQEAKRGMSRNLKILMTLRNEGSLSKQCSNIVNDLIRIILNKEKEEMLLGPVEHDHMNEYVRPDHDHMITVPLGPSSNDYSRRVSVAQVEDNVTHLHNDMGTAGAYSGATYGHTMAQLHKVFKDASDVRHRHDGVLMDQRAVGVTDEFGVPETLLSPAQSAAPTVNASNPSNLPDLTQFWLWDFELSLDSASDWSLSYNV